MADQTPERMLPVNRAALAQRLRPAFRHLRSIEIARGARLSLQEIADQRVLPIGCWHLVGAKRARPAAVWWQWLGRYESGAIPKPSCVHLTRDGKVTLCRQQIPTDPTRFVVTFAQADHGHCAYCRVANEGGRSRYDTEGVR